ncbi:iron reductase [Dentipellis sp. KUC8613]|nr:iron reductase [Dentipellis sp. KUC8613]
MSGFGAPPEIPQGLQIYNSYDIDPKWQRKFSIVWASFTGLAVVLSLPYLLRSIRARRAFTGLFGIWEDLSGKRYASVAGSGEAPSRRRSRIGAVLRSVGSVLLWSPPGLRLDVGQMLVIIGYLVTIIICIVMNAELVSNANRAGFLAIAQLPVVFLFATKNSVLSLLLGPGHGYEQLNYIHRWSGRGIFLGAVIHGALWIRNHLQYDLPILGPQKETSGVATFALLCLIVLSSLRPVRVFFYQIFWILHILLYPAFFITLCYHTIYAAPWIYPPLAFYGLDLLMRLLRFRIKDATLIPSGQQMTLIQVHDCDGGWEAGQHVRLRVFLEGRFFESHPLSIACAPPSTSCLSSRTLLLAARVQGDWTRALHRYACEEHERVCGLSEKHREGEAADVPVQVMLDGPYGGCGVDLGRYENVLLVAGGAGATFTLGLLDDIVGRCVRLGRRHGERTRRIEFTWMIRSFGCVEWFAPMLMDIANVAAGSSVDLHVSIFVTCLCNPEAVPPIPNSRVSVERPSVRRLLARFITPPSSSSPSSGSSSGSSSPDCDPEDKIEDTDTGLQWVGEGGGVAVCASGPEGLTTETRNAVARLSLTHGVRMGGIALHTELFSM